MEPTSNLSTDDDPELPAIVKFPAGIIILCIYLGYSILAKLWGIHVSFMMVGPYVLGKLAVVGYGFLSAGGLSIGFFGVLKRRRWARMFLIGWFGFWLFYSVFDFLLTFVYRSEIVELYGRVLPQEDHATEFTVMLGKLMITAIIVIINSIVCWYLSSKKEFFVR